ncbi:MAG: PAS domain S-box protein [Betaproteobacteria bacterium]|nr:PAS domain S-box protein [Betaproteobacteria bacterium]
MTTRAGVLAATRRAAQGLLRRAPRAPVPELPDPAVLLAALGLNLVVTRGRRLAWANAAAARLLGYPMAELLGLAPEALFATPRSFRRQALAARAALDGGGTHSFLQLLRTRGGELRWVRITGRRLDPADSAAGALWSIEDVQQAAPAAEAMAGRSQRPVGHSAEPRSVVDPGAGHCIDRADDAESALRARDERVRELVSEVPGLVYQFRVDPRGWMSLPFASEGIRHIFGVTPDDVRSDARPAFARLHPDDLPGVIAAVQASARDLAPLLCEARVTLPDGTVRWRRAEGRPERSPDGGTVWHGYISDIHALKEAEAALRDSEDRFRSVFEQTGIGIAILDHGGRIVDGNAVLRRMVDYSFDELRGTRAIDLAHPDDRPAIEAAQRSFVSGASSVHSRELRFVRKDGSSVWFHATLSMIPRHNAAPVVTVVLEDIGERVAALRALRASEALYGSLVDAIPLCIYRIDLEGRIVFVNRALQERIGQPLAAIVGRNGYEFFGPERAARYRAVDREIIATGRDFHEIEEHVSRRTGQRVFTEITKVPVRDTDGRIVGIQGLFSDVTGRIEAEREIRLLANVFESSHQAIMITDATPRIVRVNAAFEQMTGYTEAEVRGRKPSVLRADIRPRGFYADMWRRLELSGRWDGELWNRRKDGSPYPELLSIGVVRDRDGKVTHYVGQFADITERKATQARIEYLAHHDVVTELPNRALLADRAQVLFAQVARRNVRAGVLFLDLDRFKNVNDALGHDMGDELLREAGRRLSAAVRSADTVSRTGGDEFVVLLSELQHPEDAGRIARNLQDRLAEPFHLEGREASVTCSIGIAIYPDNGRDLGELQRNADAAMYSAKARGRNRFCFYVPAMNERASDRLAVENDLRRALRGDEFFAEYQPQVNLATGEAVGFEALARWRHPDRGIVPPAEFIPIAEETGLIVPLGERILEIACRQRRDCYDHGLRTGTVAVNVSALQFREVRFVDDVRRVLRATRLPPALLELEVTESVLMHGADTVAATLAELADLGVGLAIDDFGTGYSSLSYLKHFPVRRLKIDQSFVHEMTRDANSGAIVEAIIALGRVLGMSVVAEGVETAEQLQVLRDFGCDDVQGYFVRRPASAAEIMSLCASGAFAHVRRPTA